MSHPWRHSRSGWMGLRAPDGAVGVTVHCGELDPIVFKYLFQQKPFCDSMMNSNYLKY